MLCDSLIDVAVHAHEPGRRPDFALAIKPYETMNRKLFCRTEKVQVGSLLPLIGK
jgi:hypothetical protein